METPHAMGYGNPKSLILSIFENFIDARNHVVHKINGFSNSDTFSVRDQ